MTDQLKKQIIDLRLAGQCGDAIKKQLHIRYEKVKMVITEAEENGIEFPPIIRKSISSLSDAEKFEQIRESRRSARIVELQTRYREAIPQIINLYNQGNSLNKISIMCNVVRDFVSETIKRARENGQISSERRVKKASKDMANLIGTTGKMLNKKKMPKITHIFKTNYGDPAERPHDFEHAKKLDTELVSKRYNKYEFRVTKGSWLFSEESLL